MDASFLCQRTSTLSESPRQIGDLAGLHAEVQGWVSKTHFPSGVSYQRKLNEPVREGVQALERAGLVLATRHQQGQWMAATRLGQTALADGTVQDHLVGQPTP